MPEGLDWVVVLIHVCLAPVYLIVGTAKHELAHAIAAKLYGFEVLMIRVLPSRIDGNLYWGYVRWRSTDGAPPSKHMYLAPYYVDMVLTAAGCAVLYFVEIGRPHVWAAVVALMLVAPLVDIFYNLGKWLIRGVGDFASVERLGG